MKNVKLGFLSLVVLAAVSCNENKETVTTSEDATPVTDVAKVARTEGTSVTINSSEVPEPVAKSFTVKYPKAERVVWMQYEPIEFDDLKMDEKYYYVRYNADGADYVSWYDNNGEWVKTSTKLVNNSGLPDAVNNTIVSQYQGYEVVEVDKENDKNREMYEVELKKGDDKVKLKILPDGSIFKKS